MKETRAEGWAKWQLAYIKADVKEIKRQNAVYLARQWASLAKKPASPRFYNQLLESFGVAVWNALKRGNADFFRHFANALEKDPHCYVRFWLCEKHRPNTKGRIPRFTHAELLTDAGANNIKISDRQLRRLMSEMGFSFRFSRRQ